MATIGSAYTVGTCIANLPTKYGNRQNFGFNIPGQQNYTNQNLADGSLATLALLEAIKELTETYEFEELKYQTPVPPATTLNLTTGNGIVPIGTLLGTIPGNTVYPQFQTQNFIDLTDVYTFWIWFSGGPNQAGRTLKYRRITTVDSYSYGITSNQQGNLGTAPPVYYSRFGTVLQVGPLPDNNYDFFVRMKLRHPFPVPWGGSGAFIPASLVATIVAGAVSAVAVTNGGSGYQPSSTIPVVFSAPPSPAFVQAQGNATTSAGGVVTAVTVTTAGTGYQTAPSCNTAVIANQQVFSPDSWQELYEISACLRIAMWEGASEYVEMFQGQLDQKVTALNLKRTADMMRMELHNERQLSLRVAQYTGAR
jgi:hypothetical protein